MDENPLAKLQLEHLYNEFVAEQVALNVPRTSIASFKDFASQLAQHWRPQHLKPKEPNHEVRIEGYEEYSESDTYREHMINLRSKIHSNEDAAIIIQRAWRRHIDMQVYKYYKELINFKARGNPSIMLRCINPTEAKLLDAAAGINVRFRLAGDRFPPNIYYKIFTNRPIQDLCANSPKDYTSVKAKKLAAKDAHSHVRVPKIPSDDDREGWYRRIENNGWRLVSDRLIHHIMNDPITLETSKKEYKFDHSRLKRKQDVERKKKEKKVEWMQKLYKQGMLQAKAQDYETRTLIEDATAGMMATVESQGIDALEDWEVDELLDWTTSLNFEEYRTSWTDLATSAMSQKLIEDRFRISTADSDPFELSLSTGPSRLTSTRQSLATSEKPAIRI